MNHLHSKCSALLLGAAIQVGASQAASANINLELRPIEGQTVGPNCPINLQLYAISDSRENQTISAIQVILNWDQSKVTLVGTNSAGGATWLSSGFGAEPYHLNDSLTDGDGMWIAFAPLGSANVIQVPPSGKLLTTFIFEATSAAAATSSVEIAASGGDPTGFTIVYSGAQPNHNITGTLQGSPVHITDCAGDVTFDSVVNANDLLHVINNWGSCPLLQPCCPGDATADGNINANDLLIVINSWGACP